MDKEYLTKKYLNCNLTKAEQNAFDLLEDRDLCLDIIERAKYFDASHFSEVSSFDSIEKRLENKSKIKKINWFVPLMRVAAVFAVGFGIYFLFFYSSLTNVSTLAAEKTVVELPDGSIVNLNALSEISYNKNNWSTNRQLNLNGEAFFKVAKGEVFDVQTDLGKVTVVGTQFNVKKRSNYFEVICYEGIVKVSTKDTIKKLLAGDTFRLYNGISTFDTTSFQAPTWTNNMSSFKSIPFHLVVKELEQQYGISISFNPNKAQLLFTGGFTHTSLEEALKSIAEPLELTYKIESSNRVILLNNGK
jgi:ferric-dicitrate binding protein FerR (iron transport regulator)